MPLERGFIARGQQASVDRAARGRRQHELSLARIAAGNQPNRTPGPKFLASRGIPSGEGEVDNPLLNNVPPQKKKRRRGDKGYG
jgi:hypothetical protein